MVGPDSPWVLPAPRELLRQLVSCLACCSSEHEAVRAEAAFLDFNRAVLPAGAVPRSRTALAVLAIEVPGDLVPTRRSVVVSKPTDPRTPMTASTRWQPGAMMVNR